MKYSQNYNNFSKTKNLKQKLNHLKDQNQLNFEKLNKWLKNRFDFFG